MKISFVALVLTSLALCAYAELEEAAGPCVTTLNAQSGTVYVAGMVANTACTWYIVPPSSDYQFVTLTFANFNTESGYDIAVVYDGPDSDSAVINELSGNLGYRVMSTTQAYATVKFSTDGSVGSAGFALSYEFSTASAPSCAGPYYISDTYGSFTYELYGVDSNMVGCQWILVPNPAYVDNCYSYYYIQYDWQDDADTAVVSLFSSPSTNIDYVGNLGASGSNYYVVIQEGASITSKVTPFEGSYTTFTVTYSLYYSCDHGGDSSSDWDSSSGWWDSSSSWWWDSSSSWWWDSSSSVHHPLLWIVIVSATTVVVIVVLVFIIRHVKNRKATQAYQPLPPQGNYVFVPMMQTPQPYGAEHNHVQ